MEVQVSPITANIDVLKLYHKQKTEFHFQQKTDNEFLIFLLDVAIKVISFVDQLKPNLIDACSEEPPDLSSPPQNSLQSFSKFQMMKPAVDMMEMPTPKSESPIQSSPKVSPVENEDKRALEHRQKSVERPPKVQKQNYSVQQLPPFKAYSEAGYQRQSELLQRQNELLQRQVESFPSFPTLPDSVIKPTFVTKDRMLQEKSSLQSSPTDQDKMETDGESSADKSDKDEPHITSTPKSSSVEYHRSRSEGQRSEGQPTLPSGNTYLPTSVSRHLPIPTMERNNMRLEDCHNLSLSPSKLREHGLLDGKPRTIMEMSKLGNTTIPSMAYMFSDKLATAAENTSENMSPRPQHNVGSMQWASEYKFDGSALHIMNGRNSRKPRTVFTWEQLKQMEETFKLKKYLCTEDRMLLAQKLDLTDEQIKVWFQNRRQKWKKGGSKDDEVIEYSQYYELFSREGIDLEGGPRPPPGPGGEEKRQGEDSNDSSRAAEQYAKIKNERQASQSAEGQFKVERLSNIGTSVASASTND